MEHGLNREEVDFNIIREIETCFYSASKQFWNAHASITRPFLENIPRTDSHFEAMNLRRQKSRAGILPAQRAPRREQLVGFPHEGGQDAHRALRFLERLRSK